VRSVTRGELRPSATVIPDDDDDDVDDIDDRKDYNDDVCGVWSGVRVHESLIMICSFQTRACLLHDAG